MLTSKLMTAMITPFDHDGKINYDMVKKLARHLVNSGSDGLVLAASTGEAAALSFEEKINLFKTVVNEIDGEVPIIANTGSYNTYDSINLTIEAEKVGVTGIMLVTPYYNKPSQAGLIEHFSIIAKATSLPIILYNIPSRTSVNIEPLTLKHLSKIENIIGLKEATGNMYQLSEIISMLPKDFTIYSGDDACTLPMLSLGAKGVISVASHLVSKEMNEMITAFYSGDITKAKNIHMKLYPLFKTLFITTNPTMIKAALNMVGWQTGVPRLPLVKANKQEETTIRPILQQLGFTLAPYLKIVNTKVM